MSDGSSLTAEELRVLASLIEKSNTTPDQYPLSSNALTNACNQKSSRDPVVDYTVQQVDQTLQLLRDAGWVRMIRGKGNRTFKHRHVIDEKLGLTTPQQAVIAVLALRGPQSPGELKTRTDRYHQFADLDEVETVLEALAGRERPLVRNVGRASGQSQDRWVQLLGDGMTSVETNQQSVVVQQDPGGEGGSSAAPTGPQRSPIVEPVPLKSVSDESLWRLPEDGLDVVHAFVGETGTIPELVRSVQRWNGRFAAIQDAVVRGEGGVDVRAAMATDRTAVVLAADDPTFLNGDSGRVEIAYQLGVRFLALTADSDGAGIVSEMNRIGMIVELGRCAPHAAIEIAARSNEPPVITGRYPDWWRSDEWSAPDEVFAAVRSAGGLITLGYDEAAVGDGVADSVQVGSGAGEDDGAADFGLMVAEAIERYGVDGIAIGSQSSTPGEGRMQVDAVVDALVGLGLDGQDIDAVTGGNWIAFYDRMGKY